MFSSQQQVEFQLAEVSTHQQLKAQRSVILQAAEVSTPHLMLTHFASAGAVSSPVLTQADSDLEISPPSPRQLTGYQVMLKETGRETTVTPSADQYVSSQDTLKMQYPDVSTEPRLAEGDVSPCQPQMTKVMQEISSQKQPVLTHSTGEVSFPQSLLTQFASETPTPRPVLTQADTSGPVLTTSQHQVCNHQPVQTAYSAEISSQPLDVLLSMEVGSQRQVKAQSAVVSTQQPLQTQPETPSSQQMSTLSSLEVSSRQALDLHPAEISSKRPGAAESSLVSTQQPLQAHPETAFSQQVSALSSLEVNSRQALDLPSAEISSERLGAAESAVVSTHQGIMERGISQQSDVPQEEEQLSSQHFIQLKESFPQEMLTQYLEEVSTLEPVLTRSVLQVAKKQPLLTHATADVSIPQLVLTQFASENIAPLPVLTQIDDDRRVTQTVLTPSPRLTTIHQSALTKSPGEVRQSLSEPMQAVAQVSYQQYPLLMHPESDVSPPQSVLTPPLVFEPIQQVNTRQQPVLMQAADEVTTQETGLRRVVERVSSQPQPVLSHSEAEVSIPWSLVTQYASESAAPLPVLTQADNEAVNSQEKLTPLPHDRSHPALLTLTEADAQMFHAQPQVLQVSTQQQPQRQRQDGKRVSSQQHFVLTHSTSEVSSPQTLLTQFASESATSLTVLTEPDRDISTFSLTPTQQRNRRQPLLTEALAEMTQFSPMLTPVEEHVVSQVPELTKPVQVSSQRTAPAQFIVKCSTPRQQSVEEVSSLREPLPPAVVEVSTHQPPTGHPGERVSCLHPLRLEASDIFRDQEAELTHAKEKVRTQQPSTSQLVEEAQSQQEVLTHAPAQHHFPQLKFTHEVTTQPEMLTHFASVSSVRLPVLTQADIIGSTPGKVLTLQTQQAVSQSPVKTDTIQCQLKAVQAAEQISTQQATDISFQKPIPTQSLKEVSSQKTQLVHSLACVTLETAEKELSASQGVLTPTIPQIQSQQPVLMESFREFTQPQRVFTNVIGSTDSQQENLSQLREVSSQQTLSPHSFEEIRSKQALPSRLLEGSSQQALPSQVLEGSSQQALSSRLLEGSSQQALPSQLLEGSRQQSLPSQLLEFSSQQALYPQLFEVSRQQTLSPHSFEEVSRQQALPSQLLEISSQEALHSQLVEVSSQQALSPQLLGEVRSQQALSPQLLEEISSQQSLKPQMETVSSQQRNQPRTVHGVSSQQDSQSQLQRISSQEALQLLVLQEVSTQQLAQTQLEEISSQRESQLLLQDVSSQQAVCPLPIREVSSLETDQPQSVQEVSGQRKLQSQIREVSSQQAVQLKIFHGVSSQQESEPDLREISNHHALQPQVVQGVSSQQLSATRGLEDSPMTALPLLQGVSCQPPRPSHEVSISRAPLTQKASDVTYVSPLLTWTDTDAQRVLTPSLPKISTHEQVLTEAALEFTHSQPETILPVVRVSSQQPTTAELTEEVSIPKPFLTQVIADVASQQTQHARNKEQVSSRQQMIRAKLTEGISRQLALEAEEMEGVSSQPPPVGVAEVHGRESAGQQASIVGRSQQQGPEWPEEHRGGTDLPLTLAAPLQEPPGDRPYPAHGTSSRRGAAETAPPPRSPQQHPGAACRPPEISGRVRELTASQLSTGGEEWLSPAPLTPPTAVLGVATLLTPQSSTDEGSSPTTQDSITPPSSVDSSLALTSLTPQSSLDDAATAQAAALPKHAPPAAGTVAQGPARPLLLMKTAAVSLPEEEAEYLPSLPDQAGAPIACRDLDSAWKGAPSVPGSLKYCYPAPHTTPAAPHALFAPAICIHEVADVPEWNPVEVKELRIPEARVVKRVLGVQATTSPVQAGPTSPSLMQAVPAPTPSMQALPTPGSSLQDAAAPCPSMQAVPFPCPPVQAVVTPAPPAQATKPGIKPLALHPFFETAPLATSTPVEQKTAAQPSTHVPQGPPASLPDPSFNSGRARDPRVPSRVPRGVTGARCVKVKDMSATKLFPNKSLSLGEEGGKEREGEVCQGKVWQEREGEVCQGKVWQEVCQGKVGMGGSFNEMLTSLSLSSSSSSSTPSLSPITASTTPLSSTVPFSTSALTTTPLLTPVPTTEVTHALSHPYTPAAEPYTHTYQHTHKEWQEAPFPGQAASQYNIPQAITVQPLSGPHYPSRIPLEPSPQDSIYRTLEKGEVGKVERQREPLSHAHIVPTGRRRPTILPPPTPPGALQRAQFGALPLHHAELPPIPAAPHPTLPHTSLEASQPGVETTDVSLACGGAARVWGGAELAEAVTRTWTQPRRQAGSPTVSCSPASPSKPSTPASPSTSLKAPAPSHALQQPTVKTCAWPQGSLQPPVRGPGDQPVTSPAAGTQPPGHGAAGAAAPPTVQGQLSAELQALVNSFRQAGGGAPQQQPASSPAAAPLKWQGMHSFQPCPHPLAPAPLEVKGESELSPVEVKAVVSDCSLGGEDGAGRRVEALTSPTWRGRFLLERDLHPAEDDWGASDESITFVFMTPEEEAAARQPAQASPPASPGDRYRSSPDLSQAGLSLGLPHGARRVHPYDLYRAAGASLARAASLDSVSRALRRLGAARLRAGLTRTSSLEEDASQEVRDILERGRRCSSEESLQKEVSPPLSPALSPTLPRLPSPAPRSPSPTPLATSPKPHAITAGSRSFPAPSPSPSAQPSPSLTFSEESWQDMKSLILGRAPPPAAARRLTAEGSRSSPQLHRRTAASVAAGLAKKAVSWTDLHGGGDLETQVPDREGEPPPPAGPGPKPRSIMKRPSLTTIAPTPPPPTPKPCSPPASLTPPPQVPRPGSPHGPDASSDEDSLPLPRSNLRHLFSLRLPHHIRERVLRGVPMQETAPLPRASVVSPPAPPRVPRLPLQGGAGLARPSASLSTEEGGSSTSLSSAVFPVSRGSSSGVSCSGFSSTGAISSPGGFSPLRETSTASRVLDALSPGRPAPAHTHTPSSSVPSTPTDGVFTAPASPSTTLSAPTTPTLVPRQGGGAEGGVAGGAGLRCRSEGDLAGRGGAGVVDTWDTLSRVVLEAGQVLKTLSETSLALHQQALSPGRTPAPLPPLPEEGGGAPARRVASVGVQTDRRHLRALWRDVYTSCDSLSDGETSEGWPRPAPPRRWLEVPRQHSAPPLSPPRGLHEWRERRERLSHPWGRSSSSEWDCASPGGEREALSASSRRCLALQQQRLQESCRRLQERLRLNSHKRHLRRQILSEHHNHYNAAHRCVLHSSLDFSKTPFCSHMGPPVPAPYLSTPALPTAAPPSPTHLRGCASPCCCCVSPVHLPRRHHHCRAITSPCSAHAHCASPCHAVPSEPSLSPVCRDARLEASRQQCREQLAAARRMVGGGSLSSLGDVTPPPPARRQRLIPAGGSLDAHQRQQQQRAASSSLDTPYLRGHAASLSSLPGAGAAWRGLGGVGSLSSVASEGEADHRRPSCWRGDSHHWPLGARLS